MEARWITGIDLLKTLNKKELLEAVKSGKLTAYDPEDCKKIIDYEDLLISEKKKVVVNKRKEEATTYRMPTEREIETSFTSEKKPGWINVENMTSLLYSVQQVTALLGKPTAPPSTKPPRARAKEALAEATKLRKQYPEMNRRIANKNVNYCLLKANFKPYGVKQFDIITKELDFPKAPRGAKSKKSSK